MNDMAKSIDEFLISRGGPFYELQRRLGVLQEEAFRTGRRAEVFVALAWGVPLLLSLFSGKVWGEVAERPFLLDPGAWARFFIAIGAFILTGRYLEEQLRWCLKEFTRAPVLAPSSFEAAAIAVNTSLKRLAGGMHITPAGWWSFLFSVPVLWFLLFRGLWRAGSLSCWGSSPFRSVH